MKNSVYLDSKPRYEILDGLRGVAALLVVAYHLFETYFEGSPDQPINHGYLAVDFFFVLSGFVIGYAYDDRWDKMSTWAFFKRRLIRLHPMVIFGTLFGAVMFYFGSCSSFPLINDTPWYVVLGVMLWCFTMIPLPSGMDIRGWGETNPLNGPHPLCARYPPVLEVGAWHLCGHLRRLHSHPLLEYRRIRGACRAQLCGLYGDWRLEHDA